MCTTLSGTCIYGKIPTLHIRGGSQGESAGNKEAEQLTGHQAKPAGGHLGGEGTGLIS